MRPPLQWGARPRGSLDPTRHAPARYVGYRPGPKDWAVPKARESGDRLTHQTEKGTTMATHKRNALGQFEPEKKELRGGAAGGTTDLGELLGRPAGVKPQANNPTTRSTPGWDDSRQARRKWLAENVTPMLALDQLSDEDLAALPPAARTKAKELASQAGALRAEGSQARAALVAEEAAVILEGMLDDSWSPPADLESPADLADQIRRR